MIADAPCPEVPAGALVVGNALVVRGAGLAAVAVADPAPAVDGEALPAPSVAVGVTEPVVEEVTEPVGAGVAAVVVEVVDGDADVALDALLAAVVADGPAAQAATGRARRAARMRGVIGRGPPPATAQAPSSKRLRK